MRGLRGRWPAAVIAMVAVGALLVSAQRRVDDTTTLRWAHVYEVGSPYHQRALEAAEAFERDTNGRYRLRIYPASALGSETAINEALALGAVDIIYTGASFAAASYPRIGLSDFPFSIDDYAHWKRYRDSELFAELAQGYEAQSRCVVLALTYYGFRQVTSNRPIRDPRDMRGLKIRVPNAPNYLILPRATDANAAPMPFSEVYLALQQGVVDAQENPLTTIEFKRFWEVQTHINMTAHIAPSLLTLMQRGRLEDMADIDAMSLRQRLSEAAAAASDDINTLELELIATFERRGLTVVASDRSAFREAVDRYVARGGAVVDENDLARLRELAEEL